MQTPGTPAIVDVPHHCRRRRASSAWAKYADTVRSMSFARRNSRFSGSTCSSRSCSRVLEPARRPPSVSARRTPLLNVSGVYPNFWAMETIDDHCEECSPSCSNTTRTACSRTSGQYLVLLFTTPSFHGTAKAQPIFFCSRRDCVTRGSWPLSIDGAFGKVAAVHFLTTPYGRGADSTHASDLASLFGNVINSSLARATGAPESRPDRLGTQMCRQWLRWRHVLAQDLQELAGHDGAKKI